MKIFQEVKCPAIHAFGLVWDRKRFMIQLWFYSGIRGPDHARDKWLARLGPDNPTLNQIKLNTQPVEILQKLYPCQKKCAVETR